MREKEKAYRHEMKYLISNAQLAFLQLRTEQMMKIDPHAERTKGYQIRSVYFDDLENRCFYENENGIDPREKFRIRIYNTSAERITLELKQKERGKTHKSACSLSYAQTMDLLEGKMISHIAEQPYLLQKLTGQILNSRMRPVVIVDYQRVPYVYPLGNVRVTFDRQLSASQDISQFFSPVLLQRPVLPSGMHLMEVKFDEYLPDFIRQGLQLNQLQQTAFSKFYLCRKYNLGGILK